MRLSSKLQWKDRWHGRGVEKISISINKPMFRERHRLFQKYLPKVEDGFCLEVGAYPGTYLKYFHDFFHYVPWGVEYVESCAVDAENKLNGVGVPARVIAKDFFELGKSDSPTGKGWDLTFSFGFVEHFDDVRDAVAKHIEVTRPGGFVAISIPNHFGINGTILRFMDKEKWSQHNLMSLDELVEAIHSSNSAKIVFSGYVGRLGFWNAGVYSRLRKDYPKLYRFLRAPFWTMEWMGQWIVPNNHWTSPDAMLILQKNYDHE